MSILEFSDLKYTYDGKQNVLRGVSASLEEGKLYAVLGPSGCGKTTLLSLLGGLDRPDGGRILFNGQDIARTGLARHRRKHVAFIFQSYNLIDYLTPVENVALTSKLPPLPVLERLGLTKAEARRNVLKLSGGQQQRVAIARALIAKPDVIFADEPTGNLDSQSGREVMDLLASVHREFGKTIVVITHDDRIAQMAERKFSIVDGILSEVSRR